MHQSIDQSINRSINWIDSNYVCVDCWACGTTTSTPIEHTYAQQARDFGGARLGPQHAPFAALLRDFVELRHAACRACGAHVWDKWIDYAMNFDLRGSAQTECKGKSTDTARNALRGFRGCWRAEHLSMQRKRASMVAAHGTTEARQNWPTSTTRNCARHPPTQLNPGFDVDSKR